MARRSMAGSPFVQLSPKSPSGENVIQGAGVPCRGPEYAHFVRSEDYSIYSSLRSVCMIALFILSRRPLPLSSLSPP